MDKVAIERAADACELCGTVGDLTPIQLVPHDDHIALCSTCSSEDASVDHWRCLQSSVWSDVPVVQAKAIRILRGLEAEWAGDTLDMIFLDDAMQSYVDAGQSDVDAVIHRDSNGGIITAGDTVVLIKDLPVKGGGFTAKRGTSVRNISLVSDNAEHIEGRVEGQRIVILTQFVKVSK